MSDELLRIANALERIADFYEKGLHVDIDHAHIDDIGEIHVMLLPILKTSNEI